MMPVGLQHTFLPPSLPSLLQCMGPFLKQQSRQHTRSLPLLPATPEEHSDPLCCKDSAGRLFCSVQRPFLAGPFVLYYSAPSLAFVSVLSVSLCNTPRQANFGKWEYSNTDLHLAVLQIQWRGHRFTYASSAGGKRSRKQGQIQTMVTGCRNLYLVEVSPFGRWLP